MRKTVAAIAVLLCACVGFAQNEKESRGESRPNFSGQWVIDISETKVPGFDIEASDAIREIAHREPEIKIITKTKKGEQYVPTAEYIYYTDGRGEVNGSGSKTKWSGKKLVTKLSDKDTEIVRELSAEGNKLTETHILKTRVTFRIQGPEQTQTKKTELKLVFTRTAGPRV